MCRLRENHQIEKETVILHVVEIVLEFFLRVVHRGAVRVTDLRPAGDAGFYRVPVGIVLDLFCEILDEETALRSRADKAHLAF